MAQERYYAPVAGLDESLSEDESDADSSSSSIVQMVVASDIDKDEADQGERTTTIHPLELEENDDVVGYAVEHDHTRVLLFRWTDPWIPSAMVSLIVSSPLLYLVCAQFYALFGRTWLFLPFAIHAFVASLAAFFQVNCGSTQQLFATKICTYTNAILDCLLYGFAYSLIYNILVENFFVEGDGTYVEGWSLERRRLGAFGNAGFLVVACRLVLATTAWTSRYILSQSSQTENNGQNQSACFRWMGVSGARLVRTIDSSTECAPSRKYQIEWSLRGLSKIEIVLSSFLLLWSLTSTISHFGHFDPPVIHSQHCDPLDETECMLPFPSFFHMKPDATTPTGWRVDLRSEVLPRLKGRMKMNPQFLNELDGFSTMAPMLFYMNGLKEAYEAGVSQLMGASRIEYSVRSESATLLLDVKDQKLVHHSAEIDYLDPENPLVMVFPSEPLKHNAHYALIVFNATDSYGQRLPPTSGMLRTMGDGSSKLRRRFLSEIIPSLQFATGGWLNYTNDPLSLQLIFDFHTISEESQLGASRKVRDNVLGIVQDPEWKWSEHVRVNEVIDASENCDGNSTRIARTIHGSLEVPWFLEHKRQSFHRGSMLDKRAVDEGSPVGYWGTKFIIQIPCSVRAGVLGVEGGKDVGAVIDYGHGLFGDRFESRDSYLTKLVDNNGFILAAMDWRGMSRYDLPIVIKVLLSRASLFQAVRDNLIQGFAAKYAFQDFLRRALDKMEWMKFHDDSGMEYDLHLEGVPYVFYGNSQGGILGAGYVGLSGPTKLIDRAVLGVPGTPFALIMSRSLDFRAYDSLLLLNFYNNRQIRILLYLTQMAWDSVEGSGVFAKPVTEAFPPILLQAGLGDPVVSTIAAEALARGLNASVVPHNPREPFGIPRLTSDSHSSVTLTEILYTEELASLPTDDVYAHANAVHFCLRVDPAVNVQIAEFVKSGKVLDICVLDGCSRHNAHLYC